MDTWSKVIHEKLGKRRLEDAQGVVTYLQRQPVWARIDPSAFIDNPVFDTNLATAFSERGVHVEKATKALSHGILEVKAKLLKRPAELFFSPNLPETLREFERYRWGMENGVPTNKPIDKDDHMMENLYRCVLDQPGYVPWEGVVDPVALREFDFLHRDSLRGYKPADFASCP